MKRRGVARLNGSHWSHEHTFPEFHSDHVSSITHQLCQYLFAIASFCLLICIAIAAVYKSQNPNKLCTSRSATMGRLERQTLICPFSYALDYRSLFERFWALFALCDSRLRKCWVLIMFVSACSFMRSTLREEAEFFEKETGFWSCLWCRKNKKTSRNGESQAWWFYFHLHGRRTAWMHDIRQTLIVRLDEKISFTRTP